MLNFRLPLLVLLLLLSACGEDKPPQLEKLPEDAVILAFGDSLTRGNGASSGNDYPSQLQALTRRTVINAGVPGEVSQQGLERLPALLDETRPQLMILAHGANDLLRRLPNAALEANLRAMIRLARERGVQVVMLGVPQPALLFMSGAEIYPRIAREEGVPIDPTTLAGILADEKYKSDPIHPNDTGYRRMAEAVEVLLRASGAI
jgi:lysophospholipase L1-like esterase